MAAVTVNLSFQDSLLREIDDVAARESRSRSELIREAARMYVERQRQWDDIFALGQRVARQGGLKPADVSREIAAHRKSKRR